ncbi:uncharacterized protein LOC118393694 isoform X4 [Oncorhynchus keta]|uniref:uncharacterized protein LOC118393694 isoform X4 n=1 Tax=Oncorhynchus keta TaxID=8018 RepID=UPI0015FB981D|nr:uncharacterized protein LOC118393694 isoform X4 [Oncorhynchus keta]
MDSLGMRGPSLNQDSLHSVPNAVPRGLTVGPSLANDGQLGLWCVGHALQKGMLLGVEDQSNTFDQSEDFTESLMEEVYQTIIKGNLWDRCYWIRACKDISQGQSFCFRVSELILWNTYGSQGGSLTTPGKPRKQVTPRKSREDGSPGVNSTEQELKIIESMVVEEEKSQAGIKRSKPLIYKMNKRCVRDSHSSEITNVPCSEDKLVSPADEPSKGSEEPGNVVRKAQEVQGPQVVRASCRLAAKPRKVHSLVSCIHKRLQVCKNGYLDRQVTLEITSRVGDENGRACQETDRQDRKYKLR